jgi:glycerophosphoryl diester phosphodiesterase
VAAWLYVRYVFSLPVVLLEDRQPVPALRASAQRVCGSGWRVGAILLGWQAITLAASALALGAFKLVASLALSWAGRHDRVVIPTVATLLVGQGILLALISFVAVVVHCLLILRLYVDCSVRQGLMESGVWGAALDAEPARPGRLLNRVGLGVVCLVAGFAILALAVTLPFNLVSEVKVTAHRGYHRAAPENTRAAIQSAIDAGADWAEIDVQETADGEVVVLHDRDLNRLTGDPRRLAELTLDQLRRLRFLPQYAGDFPDEQVPTLRELLAVARGQIKLNIELKYYGWSTTKSTTLAPKVARILREEEFEDDCFVASLEYTGVQDAKRHNPKLRTAVIVSAAVGDISRLDVDVLSVNAALVDDRLLREARRLGKEVHVWTVEEPRDMRRWIERGVNNIITDDPARCLEVRREWDELGDPQRLLLACRSLLK